jgi:hypothetical protein
MALLFKFNTNALSVCNPFRFILFYIYRDKVGHAYYYYYYYLEQIIKMIILLFFVLSYFSN